MPSPTKSEVSSPSLIRGMGLGSATALNMIDMIGVGPFITMPLVVSAMGGPQALLGWVLGALLAVCDGLVSAELGAALPASGGSYRYLREMYGPQKWGRLISFLFIWQVSFSAPLSIASGCIGLAGYAAYYWPELETVYAHHDAAIAYSLGRNAASELDRHAGNRGCRRDLFVYCLAALPAHHCHRAAFENLVVRSHGDDWLDHLSPGLPISTPPGHSIFLPAHSRLSPEFFSGLGGAMLVATYDYWGYYNVCFLGDEIKEPGKEYSAGLAAFHSARRLSISNDERLHSGRGAVA